MADPATDTQPVTQTDAAPDVQSPPTTPGTNTLPSDVTAGVQTGPPKPPPMSFAEGAARTLNPQYTTDAQGNVIRAEPARAPSGRGILAEILLGAAAGAARGAAAQAPEGARGRGAAVSAGASAAEKGAIAADNRARQIAADNFQRNQQAAENRAKQSLMNAQAIKLTTETDHENVEFPERMKKFALENQEFAQRLDNAKLEYNTLLEKAQEESANLLSFLSSQGIPIEKITHATASGAGTANVNTSENIYTKLQPQIPAIAGGKVALVHTGQTGADNGVALLHPDDLRRVPLSQDFHYRVYNGALNADGTPHSVDQVIAVKDAQGRPTNATAYDAMIAAKGSIGQLQNQQKQISDRLDNQHKKAQANAANAAASKDVAEAEKARTENEQLKQFLIPPGTPGATATGEEYLKSLPEPVANTIRAVAEGREVRSPRQFLDKNGNETPFTQALHRAYPDFDVAKAMAYQDVVKEFSSKGTTGKSIVNGATAVDHLSELRDLNTYESRNPLSADYKAYNDKLDTLIGELSQFYNLPKTDTQIQRMADNLGGLLNRDAAITTQAASMKDRFNNIQQSWKNSQVRPSYTPPMPGIRPETQTKLDALAGAAPGGGGGQVEPTVNMRGPDGSIVPILQSKVEEAKKRGAVVVTQ